MAYYVRLMRKEDIPQVTEIDLEAFPTQLPATDYHQELRNRFAYYIVACEETGRDETPEVKITPRQGFAGLVFRLKRLFHYNRFSGEESFPPVNQYILGFAGFWIMADEAHITSIAVRERYYRQGVGEMLFLTLLDMAVELNARLVTLEVRVSNVAAQRLYFKCGFVEVGLRRGYYTETGEDGILMSLENITVTPVQMNLQRLREAHSQRWGNVTCRISL